MTRVMPGMLWTLLPLAALLACADPVHGATVIYRCTDAKGVTTLQNGTPCPKGNRQEKKVIESTTGASLPPLPDQPVIAPASQSPGGSPVGSPAGMEPEASQQTRDANAQPASGEPSTDVLPLPETKTPAAQRLPPPPLYQCNTVENDSYLSDTADPKPRCLRVATVGIDGSQQLGAGQACTMVYDQCQRVPDNAACDAWRKRVSEAQSAWTFARDDERENLKTEYERIARVVAETTCNQ